MRSDGPEMQDGCDPQTEARRARTRNLSPPSPVFGHIWRLFPATRASIGKAVKAYAARVEFKQQQPGC